LKKRLFPMVTGWLAGRRWSAGWPCPRPSAARVAFRNTVEEPEQYQLFDTPEYTYRVFVTDMDAPLDALVGFYRGRASAENLIKEANNDAGLAAHPSKRWMMNANWFHSCPKQVFAIGVLDRGEHLHEAPEIPFGLRVALQRHKHGGQTSAKNFRVEKVVRFLKGPVPGGREIHSDSLQALFEKNAAR